MVSSSSSPLETWLSARLRRYPRDECARWPFVYGPSSLDDLVAFSTFVQYFLSGFYYGDPQGIVGADDKDIAIFFLGDVRAKVLLLP